jgi:hypothetical protein
MYASPVLSRGGFVPDGVGGESDRGGGAPEGGGGGTVETEATAPVGEAVEAAVTAAGGETVETAGTAVGGAVAPQAARTAVRPKAAATRRKETGGIIGRVFR